SGHGPFRGRLRRSGGQQRERGTQGLASSDPPFRTDAPFRPHPPCGRTRSETVFRGQAKVVGGDHPDVGAQPVDGGGERRAEVVARGLDRGRNGGGHETTSLRVLSPSPANTVRSADSRPLTALPVLANTVVAASSPTNCCAAVCPLRTAPSMVSGQPVSVHEPASTSPGTEVAAPGRRTPQP